MFAFNIEDPINISMIFSKNNVYNFQIYLELLSILFEHSVRIIC